MEILNHREMEYETNKLFSDFNISLENKDLWFDKEDTKAKELMEWLSFTSRQVSIRDIELDYGLDCIRGYLMFEKTPKENDLDMDSWEECSLEGVYKFICKFYRAMNTIYHANRQGLYQKLDTGRLLQSINKCEKDCLSLIHNENSMPNRHNILSVLMDELKYLSKECNVAKLTVKHHDEEISHAVANAGSVEAIEDDTLKNEDINFICKKYMILVSPFIPYITEQCYRLFDNKSLACMQKWDYDTKINMDTIKLPIQVNGKTKKVIEISTSLKDEEILEIAKEEVSLILGKEEYKTIYVKDKIVSFITGNK